MNRLKHEAELFTVALKRRVLAGLLGLAVCAAHAQQQQSGVPVFGCPVQYDVAGALPLPAR
jgi:hypothetical protein